MSSTVEALLADLEALGSADAIAAFLIEQDIAAEKCNSTACALAVYLHSRLGTGDLAVGDVSLTVWADPRPSTSMRVPLPATVQTFVERFDEGCYPELLAPEAVAQ